MENENKLESQIKELSALTGQSEAEVIEAVVKKIKSKQ